VSTKVNTVHSSPSARQNGAEEKTTLTMSLSASFLHPVNHSSEDSVNLPSPADQPSVSIYTDGGADPNPGPGGWGVVLIYDKDGEIITKELSGGEALTTNNRMELTAAINALQALKRPCMVEFYTDSTYVKNGITKWMATWLQNDFKKGKIENVDLWQALNAEVSRHTINWHWVKGHAGDQYNERADQLASAAMPPKQIDSSAALPRAYMRVSCVRGDGRWATLIRKPTASGFDEDLLTGERSSTTANELDLYSAIAALKPFKDGETVQVFTASSYLCNGISKWVPGWRDNGWCKRDGSAVQHVALWQELDRHHGRLRVRWILYSDVQRPAELTEVEGVLKHAVKDGSA
jgi:ribonuclease HI